TRAPRAQPSRRRTADPPLELGLAGVERIAEGGVPRELISRDRVQFEQPAHECPRLLAREVSALDQSNRMRKIRERQATSKTRTVRALGGVGRRDQIARSTAAQAPATAEFVRLRHGAETKRTRGLAIWHSRRGVEPEGTERVRDSGRDATHRRRLTRRAVAAATARRCARSRPSLLPRRRTASSRRAPRP